MRIFNGFDELRAAVGTEIGVSEWIEVTQDRINKCAEATCDEQWIHVDQERAAAESAYGGTIAHGFLTLSMLSHLSREAVEIGGNYRMRINYGLNRVRFPAAVPADARVRCRFTVAAFEEVKDALQVTWGVTIELEGSPKPACVAEWVIRMYR